MRHPATKRLKWIFPTVLLFFGAFVFFCLLWTERHDSALLTAINAGDVQAARQAFHGGASMQMRIRREFTFLQAAARHGHVEMARVLVEHGAAQTISATNQDGDTALDIALAGGHTAMADYLRSLMTNK
jgi:ankyrin repeat protein